MPGVEVTDIAGSLRRHYPVRFGRSADPRCVRTPPSQPTMWCELPKVSFCRHHANTGTKAVPRLLTLYCRMPAMYSAPSALDREPAVRPGIEAAVEVDRFATLRVQELGHAS